MKKTGEISLFSVVRFLILLLHQEGASLNLYSKGWSVAFYQMKELLFLPEEFAVLREISIDWNDTCLMCGDLVFYFRAFVKLGYVHSQTQRLNDEVAAEWKADYARLTKEERRFFETIALRLLKEGFTIADAADIEVAA